jgi:hypothetical protein
MAVHAPHTSVEAGAPRGRSEWYLGRIFLALVLFGFGLVALLDAAGAVDGDRAVDRWWPSILVLAGLLRLLERRRSQTVSIVFIVAGVVLLLLTTDVLEGDAGSYVGPVILLVAAITVLVHARVRPLAAAGDDRGVLRVDGILSGPKVASSSATFPGAFLTAFLGHVRLDLRGARPDRDGAVVTATAVLGGVEILVPPGWQIDVRGTPILGDVEDKTDHASPPAPDAPVLRVDGLAILGNVEVKHGKDAE